MCGLFGIINRHKRQLDKRAFITLGCVNDTRGGDACGIMIDGQVDRGTAKDETYFQDWYFKSKLLYDTEKCYVALGHCRKASVGGTAADKAQPVTIYDENGKMLFCMIHNGTIYNYKDLAEKYIPGIDIEGLSDSQVMAQIFFKAGYDALGEYNGGGAFVIQDYRTNETFLFKGESLGSVNAVKTEVERPLYFVATGKSIIFSSIFSVLQGLYWGFDVMNVPSNVLLKSDGYTLYSVKVYDRTKCYGCRKYAYGTATTSPMYADCGYYGSLYSAPSSEVSVGSTDGLYFNTTNKDVLHGIVYISEHGFISKYKTSYNTAFYFWKGLLLCGEKAYEAVRKYFATPGVTAEQTLELARRLSCNPVCINKRWYTYDAEGKKVFANDSWEFPLCDVEMQFSNKGKLLGVFETGLACDEVPVSLTEPIINKMVTYVQSLQRDDTNVGGSK